MPVVFLHGGTGTGAFDWGEIAERLAPCYRTVVLDLRGHGSSPHEGEDFGVVRFGLDTLHVLRALGLGRAVLVGFSVGGNTLLALLARDPRPALALVTIGASARGDPARVKEIMAGPGPTTSRSSSTRSGAAPSTGASSVPCWRTTGPGTSISQTRICAGSPARCSSVTATATGVQPVGYAEHLAAGLPDAELLLVQGAGHALQLDRPELFVEALERFLERIAYRA